MSTFTPNFLWGAATAPHQIEGNNINSDWWAREDMMPGMEKSGDACDSYHRYREDMQLLADAGYNSYRFGIEWARIEPRPGEFSNAELAHYRRMIEFALELGLSPVVTLSHFSTPRWFAEEGGWIGPKAIEHFSRYVTKATEILDGVEWIVTINEPNMGATMLMLMEQARRGELTEWQSPTVDSDETREEPGLVTNMPSPTAEFAQPFLAAHRAARAILKERTSAKVGWSIANGALTAAPGGEEKLKEVRYGHEDVYLELSREDDFVGVQSYSSQQVGPDGLIPHPPHPDNTQTGAAYRPDALGMAIRHAAEVAGVPVLVTENGIPTDDDTRRIAYTREALAGLQVALADGIDVRGYLHWSLLDNFEWGHWGPKFGLIAVDRETFIRTPKPSFAWLGNVARTNGADLS